MAILSPGGYEVGSGRWRCSGGPTQRESVRELRNPNLICALSKDEVRQLGLSTARFPRVSELLRFLRGSLLIGESYRYWLIANDTFIALSALSLAIPIYWLLDATSLNGHWKQLAVVGCALAAVLVCAYENAHVVSELMWGKYSYTCNHFVWLHIMLRTDGTECEGPAELYQSPTGRETSGDRSGELESVGKTYS